MCPCVFRLRLHSCRMIWYSFVCWPQRDTRTLQQRTATAHASAEGRSDKSLCMVNIRGYLRERFMLTDDNQQRCIPFLSCVWGDTRPNMLIDPAHPIAQAVFWVNGVQRITKTGLVSLYYQSYQRLPCFQGCEYQCPYLALCSAWLRAAGAAIACEVAVQPWKGKNVGRLGTGGVVLYTIIHIVVF